MKDSEILDKIKSIIIKRYNTKDVTITPESHLELDLGLDSLDKIEMWIDFEEEYNIDIPEEEVANLGRVSEVIDLIKQYTNKNKEGEK